MTRSKHQKNRWTRARSAMKRAVKARDREVSRTAEREALHRVQAGQDPDGDKIVEKRADRWWFD